MPSYLPLASAGPHACHQAQVLVCVILEASVYLFELIFIFKQKFVAKQEFFCHNLLSKNRGALIMQVNMKFQRWPMYSILSAGIKSEKPVKVHYFCNFYLKHIWCITMKSCTKVPVSFATSMYGHMWKLENGQINLLNLMVGNFTNMSVYSNFG